MPKATSGKDRRRPERRAKRSTRPDSHRAAGRGSSTPSNQVKHSFLFLKKFLKHGGTIASIWPSSKALSRAAIKPVDFEKASVIVELGAGTGPITEQVVTRLKPHTKFIAIERDADFARILKERFAGHRNVEIVHADVKDLDSILRARKVQHVDYFVSGLPTPILPEGVQKRMLASVRRYLPEHGVFSNITEFPWYYLRYYKAVFADVKFKFVAANLPPGGVYYCRAMR